MRLILSILALATLSWPVSAAAETGYDAWLRYEPIREPAVRARYDALPACTVAVGDSEVIGAAQRELIGGVRGMLGRTLRIEREPAAEGAIVLGTVDEVARLVPGAGDRRGLEPDGYRLRTVRAHGRTNLVVTALDERGVLYGTFALLRKIALGEPITALDETENPYAPVRMLDHWDNLDGTIERGYAGRSIFFEGGHVTEDLARVGDYARLMASVGLNGCSINNVNADTRVITPEFLPEVARLATAMRPWGVRLFVSVDFSSPQKLGGLDTFDPLDARVAAWWKAKVDEIYAAVPDFGGFVLKADSEGRLGPSAYGRTHADAANVIARALAPHHGIIFYRGFVYDHHMDWRNLKNDRARAAYDNMQPLDGKFADNAVLQIKHGPIDFQVREPASPLFGALERTSQAIELQITQEYTGQQRHLCFLVPMWKEVLDFDMHARGAGTPVKQLVAGKTFGQRTGGFVAVSNVGRDTNWLGHHLAVANLYGFGRLAWNPNLSSRRIAEEWTRQTFGPDARVDATITKMLLDSWPIYERYTGPLGAGTLTDIINVHYGPGVESSERNGWGQWHRADERGVGMDRTVATGTGYIAQYRPAVARVYESLATCPDELLLFFHHVPYTYRLHSGKTVIQHIYDSHYEGAREAAGLVDAWRSLEGRVDERRYREVLDRLEYQAGHALVWRDAVCRWFNRMSKVADAKGRVGNDPGRVEAEAMALTGYEVVDVTPWETASGAKAIRCEGATGPCTASFRYDGAPGWRRISVEYFDLRDGASRYRLSVAGQVVDEWTADMTLPSSKLDGHTSTRHMTSRVALRPGDEIRIEAVSEGGEGAPLDYVDIGE